MSDFSWLNEQLSDNDFVPAIVRVNYLINGEGKGYLLEDDNWSYLLWWLIHNERLIKRPIFSKALNEINDLLDRQYEGLNCFDGDLPFTYRHFYFSLINSEQKGDILKDENARDSFVAWLLTFGRLHNYPIGKDELNYINSPSKISSYITNAQYLLTYFHASFSGRFSDTEKLPIDIFETNMFTFLTKKFPVILSESQIEFLKKASPLLNSEVSCHYDEIMTQVENMKAFNEMDKEDNLSPLLQKLRPQTSDKKDQGFLHGVNVIGFPCEEMGIGEDARTTLRALKKNGIPVCAISISDDSSEHPKLNKEVGPYIVDFPQYAINVINSPILTLPIEMYRQQSVDMFEGRYNIGYAPWELEKWPEKYDFVYKFYDEIWASTRFIQKAFENLKIPVVHRPLAVTLIDFEKRDRSYFGLPEDKFIYLSMFDFNSSMHRKNPWAIVRSFKKAFSENENVVLAIKVMYKKDSEEWRKFEELIGNDQRIVVINKVFSREDLLALIDCSDAFVSLHRSEGFGRCLAEAMLLEKPVIATNYSGNVDFSGCDFSYAVDYNLVELDKGEYIFGDNQVWADPDEKSAVEQLKKVYKESGKVVVSARKNIEENFSEQACGLRYKERIENLNR